MEAVAGVYKIVNLLVFSFSRCCFCKCGSGGGGRGGSRLTDIISCDYCNGGGKLIFLSFILVVYSPVSGCLQNLNELNFVA